MNGGVIVINAAKYSDTSVEGIGYAIPISQAKDIIMKYRSVLDACAELLLEKEKIGREEFEEDGVLSKYLQYEC